MDQRPAQVRDSGQLFGTKENAGDLDLSFGLDEHTTQPFGLGELDPYKTRFHSEFGNLRRLVWATRAEVFFLSCV